MSRGKAAKMIISIWKSSMDINRQEMTHIRYLNDVELTTNFLSGIKVTGAGIIINLFLTFS